MGVKLVLGARRHFALQHPVGALRAAGSTFAFLLLRNIHIMRRGRQARFAVALQVTRLGLLERGVSGIWDDE